MRFTLKNKNEWVYILSNPSMPGLLKIGMTKRDPKIRARELASETGVPTKFEIEYAVQVTDALAVEQSVHKRLNRYRVNSDREFFKVDIKRAKKVVDQQAENFKRSKVKDKSFLRDMGSATIISVLGLTFLTYFPQFNPGIGYRYIFIGILIASLTILRLS